MKSIYDFTYEGYRNLIDLIKDRDYHIVDYQSVDHHEKTLIMRHDVDFSLSKALEMALLENQLGVKSTYFLLLSSNFYNVFSYQSLELIKEIMHLNHQIGLHFDEQKYVNSDGLSLTDGIIQEASLISQVLGKEIKVFSMHRPSKETLEKNYQVNGLINTYSIDFFQKIKYLSDSRRNWRENIIDAITSNQHPKIQLLTHPISWTLEKQSTSEVLKDFIKSKTFETYQEMKQNFRNLEEFISEEDYEN